LTCHGPCYALVCIGRNGMWKGAVCERKHGLIRSSPEKLDGLHSLHWVMLETIDIYWLIDDWSMNWIWSTLIKPIWCSGPEIWPIPRHTQTA
jgi:hypothetical protein